MRRCLVAFDEKRVVFVEASRNVIGFPFAKGSRTLYCPRVFCCLAVFALFQ